MELSFTLLESLGQWINSVKFTTPQTQGEDLWYLVYRAVLSCGVFNLLYKVVLNLSLWLNFKWKLLVCGVPVVPFTFLRNLWFYESHWALLSCGSAYCAVKDVPKAVLIIELFMKSLKGTIQMKEFEQYFPDLLFILLNKAVLTFESGNIVKFDHSNESFWAALCCGVVYFALRF